MKKATKFSELPNEIIYHIFDYLKENEIVHSFCRLNLRYANLVRNQVKQLDLTATSSELQRKELQWIWNSIERLKLDANFLYLFNSPTKHRKRKSFFICSKKANKNSSRKAEINLNFCRIKTVELVNMKSWSTFLTDKICCDKVSVWFDGSTNEYFDETHFIPLTIKSFSTNSILSSNSFHSNLIELNLTNCSIIKLIEILDKTPRIKILSVKFANNFTCSNSIETDELEMMISNLNRLNCLEKLSLSTKTNQLNTYFPFKQIDLFLNQCCCSTQRILSKLSLKFDYISFDWEIYHRLIQYESQFDRFHIYISFIIERNLVHEFIERLNFDGRFVFYLEENLDSNNCFIHIYTKPFVFESFNGFLCANQLDSSLVYRTVRHLYFTRIRLHRCLSFENLSKQMPNLISIDCDITFDVHLHNQLSQILINENSFPNIRSLRFLTHCLNENCICQNYLLQLLKQMPNLQTLITSQINFLSHENQFVNIREFDLRQCHFQVNNQLISRAFPNLTQLLLGYLLTSSNELFEFIYKVFIQISTLKLISFRLNSKRENDRIRAQQTFNRLKQTHKYFRHFQLEFANGKVNFYLRKIDRLFL